METTYKKCTAGYTFFISPICNQVWQIRYTDSSKGKDEKNGAKL